MARPVDPHVAARGKIQDRYSDLAKSRQAWQLATILALAVALVLGIGYVHAASTASVVPYVVQVDGHGEALFLGAAERVKKTDVRIIQSELTRLLLDLRTIAHDTKVNRQALERAYAHLSGPAEQLVSRHLADNNPAVLVFTLQRLLEIESLLPIPGTDSWSARWVETDYPLQGGPRLETAWQAVLTVEFRPPPNDFDLLKGNPLGIFLTGLTWSPVSTTP